jgi:hypothetical protein
LSTALNRFHQVNLVVRDDHHMAETPSPPDPEQSALRGSREGWRPVNLRESPGGVVCWDHTDTAQLHLLNELRALMDAGARLFCDVGGGANPIVSARKVAQAGLRYVILDASENELQKAPSGYERFSGDILDPEGTSRLVAQHGSFDVVTSRFTAEHVPDGRLFHERVFTMLRPGGHAVHLFPTLYSPPFVMNRLLPTDASAPLLHRASKGDRTEEGRHPKFRSYYSWCRGPSRGQLARLRSVGFSVERYIGFFGHGYYRRVRPLDVAHRAVTELLLDHPLASMTSFALVVLKRPERS